MRGPPTQLNALRGNAVLGKAPCQLGPGTRNGDGRILDDQPRPRDAAEDRRPAGDDFGPELVIAVEGPEREPPAFEAWRWRYRGRIGYRGIAEPAARQAQRNLGKVLRAVAGCRVGVRQDVIDGLHSRRVEVTEPRDLYRRRFARKHEQA